MLQFQKPPFFNLFYHNLSSVSTQGQQWSKGMFLWTQTVWCWFWMAVSSRKSPTPSSGFSMSRVWCRPALSLGLLWSFWATSDAIMTGLVLTLRGTAGLWTCSFLCTTVFGSTIKTSFSGPWVLPRKRLVYFKEDFLLCYTFIYIISINISLIVYNVLFLSLQIQAFPSSHT